MLLDYSSAELRFRKIVAYIWPLFCGVGRYYVVVYGKCDELCLSYSADIRPLNLVRGSTEFGFLTKFHH